jgi:hypothetical protein
MQMFAGYNHYSVQQITICLSVTLAARLLY